jgi:hypothetical protein
MIEQDTKRQKLLERVLDKAPVFINEDQRRAFLRMANDDDAAIVGQLLSSLHSTDLSQFPATIKQATAPTKARPDADTVELAGYLGPTRKFPGQR